ncbi:unnamed protein product [Phytophthora fragariaefolia]|uniref:Unnamed protein product n=1 Tax=Phytophthora fragariaefolia TaxID=1490495 RepID=A0A9W7D1X1_9STRA|nr:unnamed protein product [Phytophthora fragariaefolia]
MQNATDCSPSWYTIPSVMDSTCRLESSWQKIKTKVDQNVDIDESVTSLIWWAKVKQKSFTTELARLGQSFDSVHLTNVELTRLAQMVSRYAFDIVKKQVDIASNPDTYYNIRDEGNELYVVASATTTCKVDTSTWVSYCMLVITHKLPCRHLIYLRKHVNVATPVPFSFLGERWRFNSAVMLDRFLGSDYKVSGYSDGCEQRGGFELDVKQVQREERSDPTETREVPLHTDALTNTDSHKSASIAGVGGQSTRSKPEPDVVVLDDFDEDNVPATVRSERPNPAPIHLWFVMRGLKAVGRPKVTVKQRKFARRKKNLKRSKRYVTREREYRVSM